MLLKRAAHVFSLPLIALLLLPSCVHVEQTLTLDQDGGGMLMVQYTMSLETLAEIEARARAEAEELGEEVPVPLSFDEAQVREDFKEYEPLGITLEDAASWESDGKKSIRLKMRFTSLAALTQTEFLSDRQLRVRRLEDGTVEFTQVAPPADPITAEMQALMREMMAGFRAVLTVKTPTDILESNADEQDVRLARWVFDVERDARALARAQQLDLRVRFAAGDPPMPEFPAE